MPKPTGQYEIDWSNDITKDLLLCIPMMEGCGNVYDLVSKRLLQTDAEWGVGADGLETVYDKNSNNNITFSGLEDLSGSEHTVFMRMRINSFDQNGAVPFGWSNNGAFYWQHEVNGETVAIAAQSTHSLTVDGTDGLFHNNFYVASASKLGLYQDGVKKTEAAKTATLPSGSKDIQIGKWVPGDTWSLDGSLSIICVFNRRLSEREIISLDKDPYQFLKPVLSLQDSVYAALFPTQVGGTAVARDDGPYHVLENETFTLLAPGILANDDWS